MCINNAWILQKKIKPKISQFQYKRDIVSKLLTRYGTAPKIGDRPPTSISVNRFSDDVRYNRKEYHVTKKKKRKR